MWVIFALLDPDPYPDSESGSTGPIESGSNPDPDPKPWILLDILLTELLFYFRISSWSVRRWPCAWYCCTLPGVSYSSPPFTRVSHRIGSDLFTLIRIHPANNPTLRQVHVNRKIRLQQNRFWNNLLFVSVFYQIILEKETLANHSFWYWKCFITFIYVIF